MASGVYGTTIPSKISSSDVDIYYSYHETRNSDSVSNSTFTKLPSSILSDVLYNNESDSTDNVLEGLYNLKLPLQYFNRKGFYTVYIKPKEFAATIIDVASLTSFPNVRGIVLNSSDVEDDTLATKIKTNNALVGYRVIYMSDNGKREDYFRLITSNNKCEPVVQMSSDNTNKAYTYRYNESSTLSFITMTPSSAPSFKSNAAPYIGKPTQKIILVNTMFEPVMLDIEMTDKDVDTISYMLEGSQLRDLDNGIVTTFDNDGNIYNQREFYTLKDKYTGKPVYEVGKLRTDNIDFTQTINDK